MKKSTALLFFSLFVYSLNAQIITFSDPVFKAKLLESSSSNFIARDLNGDYFSIDTNSNGNIEIAEALQVGFLQIENSSIVSITGIENFTNLISLNCENNQITVLDASGLLSLTILNCSNNQLNSLTVNGLSELRNLNCQFNQLIDLNVSGITNLLDLNCSYNQIVNLTLSNLLNLEMLTCNDNAITSFDLSDLISLTTFDCSNNQLSSINTSSLVNLVTLNCNSNALASLTIDNLVNFNNLNCSNNELTSLSLSNLSNLTELNCNFNLLPLLNLNGLSALKNFSCTNNQLFALNFSGVPILENLNCSDNIISGIDLTGLNQLISLNCNNNQLTALDMSNLSNLKYLYCNLNSISTMNIYGVEELIVLSCSNNQLTNLNLGATTNLQSLYCSDNQITNLNLSNLTNFQNLFCSNNELVSLFIKNGSFENNLLFSGNPNLEFVCADAAEIYFVQDEITNNNYTNCHVNSYCSFVPGGISYTVQGNTTFDSNSNGCDALDTFYPNLQFSVSDGALTENLIANISGTYSKSLKNGSYTITPLLENAAYFTITPQTIVADFPQDSSPFVQNFCVAANGNHSDMEIVILPLNNAIPGQEAKYKIVYKNKGTIIQSGSVNLSFNHNVLDLLQSNPVSTTQSSNNLNWSFTNLNPLEARIIFVTLNVNSSSDTFPVNVGQVLAFTASATGAIADETPNNNIIHFNQTVEDISITNDKICIEGNTIATAQVGDYVHYCIRFKNIGTEIAQNVVVKDIIDTTKYDFGTLLIIDGSHLFETRLTDLNTVEFIFENINLASGDDNSDGYVMFKIKTLATLVEGDTFANTASIFFDYQAPEETNIATTIIQTLSNEVFESPKKFHVYPNPVKEVLNIFSENLATINSISLHNSAGQLLQIIANPNTLSITVSELKTGVYFLTIHAENTNTCVRFIKE